MIVGGAGFGCHGNARKARTFPRMNRKRTFLVSGIFAALAACSSPEVIQKSESVQAPESSEVVTLTEPPVPVLEDPSFVPAENDLPVLSVSTEGGVPIVSKDTYVPGGMTLDGLQHTLRIRGCGNTTWGMPKKPYKIKLDSKAGLLGMPADKE